MLGIENDRLVVLANLSIRIRNLVIKRSLNTYKIGSSLVIRDSLSLDLSLLQLTHLLRLYRCHFIEYKWNCILSCIRIISESFQRRSNGSSFEQLQFPLLIHLQRTVEIELNLACTIIASSTQSNIVASILDESSNTLVAAVT